MSISDDRSSNWTSRPVAAERKAKRSTLDYVTWRTHIAAPGSRFAPEQTAEPRIIRLDPARYAPASLERDKWTA